MGRCCMIQGAEPRLCDDLEGWDGMGEAQRKGRYYTYEWLTLLYGRNQHTIVKQLSSNQKKNSNQLKKKEVCGLQAFWKCSCLRLYLHHPKSQIIIFYTFLSVSYLSLHFMTLISRLDARLSYWNLSNCTYIAA